MRKSQHNRADQTRDRILHAAIREFSEHGLAGARTGAIASEAQVNKALLYYYFRDKEALYAAALGRSGRQSCRGRARRARPRLQPGRARAPLRPAALRPASLPPRISGADAAGDGPLPHGPVQRHAHAREKCLRADVGPRRCSSIAGRHRLRRTLQRGSDADDVCRARRQRLLFPQRADGAAWSRLRTPWNRARWRSGARPLSNTSAKPSLPTADGARVLPKSVLAAMPMPAAAIPERKTA